MPRKIPFPTILDRIRTHAGQEFRTKTGIPFTYLIEDDTALRPCPRGIPTSRLIGPDMLERAWKAWPVEGPGSFQQDILGPSYLWGIFSDPRITGGTDDP